jgi:Bax inhibitor 1
VSFVCFSLGAIFAKERLIYFSVDCLVWLDAYNVSRKYLYLGSILTSALSYLSLVSIFNLFFASPLAQDVVLYAGLFVYLGYDL